MKVNEIFVSIDGEVNAWGQGGFTTFVRLQGCNLRCKWCDTPRAQGSAGSKSMNVHGVYNEIVKLRCHKVTITGGEPFYKQAQETIDLILMLDAGGFRVSIETNGSFPVRCWLANTDNVSIIFDYKLEYEDKMAFHPNLLSKNDYIKIVIGSADQYEQAKKVVVKNFNETKAKIYFSPARPGMDPTVLIDHMRKDQLFNVGVNLQIHKHIWADGVES